jgi:hypothetical protein
MVLGTGEREGSRARVRARHVGRAEELDTLERLLHELDRGRAAVVEVAGEPGIGKTVSSRSSPPARTRVGHSSSLAPRPSSRESCRSPCSWTRSTTTCEVSSRIA